MIAETFILDVWRAQASAIVQEPAPATATSRATNHAPLAAALKRHWPEYLMEAAELALFMISACMFGVLLEHPASPLYSLFPNPHLRRALMGLAMGSTAIAIVYSPLGKRSGAHFNPSVTLTFLRLGKIEPWDAVFYILAQFAGGILGVLAASLALRELLGHPAVNYVATLPGPSGSGVAFAAEVLITFVLMSVILRVSNTPRIARWTGLCAGLLVATYITLEAPVSGMSMNPARTLGSAFWPRYWEFLWIYFTAPPIGMLAAAELYLRQKGAHRVLCAKLHHNNPHRCIFRCNFPM
jgi:aquaporin Z